MKCLTILIYAGMIIATFRIFAKAINARPYPPEAKFPNEELPPVNPNVEDEPTYSYTCIAYFNKEHYFGNYNFKAKNWDYTRIGDTLILDFHNAPEYWIPMFEEYTGLSVEGDFHEKRQKY